MLLVNITIPTYNEETRLGASVATLCRFVTGLVDFRFEIVIADNGSTDSTGSIAEELAHAHVGVRVLHLVEKGRGRALKKAWSASDAAILTYMDVDLSTDLTAFQQLVRALTNGGYHLAVGSRLARGSATTRSVKRQVISCCYNRLIKLAFATRFSDAQCGFKAITSDAAKELLPSVEDNAWFFDTELLVLAEKLGYHIYDMPVRWKEDADSRVKIMRTAIDDLKGMVRLRRRLPTIVVEQRLRLSTPANSCKLCTHEFPTPH